MNAPLASIVVPAYNATATLTATLKSLVAQTFDDFEIVVIDDGSSDGTADLAKSFNDARIRVISQANRGLAGARNSGIHHARGRYIGFCDADDLWLPEKLERHVAHLEADPNVGISFAGSELVDGTGRPLGLFQSPKLTGITARHVFCRNPIGNGSAAVVRRAAFDAIAYRPRTETERDWWFDETFRQSEDIEAWMRFVLMSDTRIEGIAGHLTRYRVHTGGLSANIESQYATWCRVRDKVANIAPRFEAKVGDRAAAYQLRYLARRAVRSGDGAAALRLSIGALARSPDPALREPVKTATTIGAALAIVVIGSAAERLIVSASRRAAA